MLQIAPVLPRKLRASVRGTGHAGAAWLRWVSRETLAEQRLWIHGASVGEGLVAKPILSRLRLALPGPVTAIHTYTSPSVATWNGDIGADRTGYLPAPTQITNVLLAFQPGLIMYPRADLWPPLVAGAGRLRIPQVIVGGRLSRGSSRLRWPARALYKEMLSQMSAVCAVSADDAERWTRIGVPPKTLRVTGDPRDDEIIAHTGSRGALRELRDWAGHGFVFVAGSTHQSDTGPIIEAVSRCPHAIRLLVVPHDSARSASEEVRRRAGRANLSANVWAPGDPSPTPDTRVVSVSANGLLRTLYGLGRAAYVGGGFEQSGVHSLAEAAAWGIPILAGGRALRDPEAARFIRGGGAESVRDGGQICNHLARWFADDAERVRMGERAQACLSHGAAEKTADIILRTLSETTVTARSESAHL
jgi:3-deoxy-D-manno-octulosonic-acid transferase